jgi:hypothetical protein
MSLGIARATYIKKIAIDKEEISNTLSLGLSIDHVFAISVAMLGGFMWNTLGYKFVFIMGAFISLLNYFAARRIKTDEDYAGKLSKEGI